jgi:pimeloyl-ACP methyl ester carboxylesterase
MIDPRAVAVVLGGYRGRQIEGSGPLAGVRLDQPIIWNEWAGHDDSLSARADRLLEWNASRVDTSKPVHLLGLSMGCQLAVHFGQFLESVDEVVLVAPDPKARPVERDSEETAAGVVSAFEEAQALWGGEAVPANPFTEALVALAAKARRLRIVFCRTDGVAEWDGNTDAFVAELATVDNVELIEAVDGHIVTASGVTVDLAADGEIDVHERLWSAIHL